MESAEPSETAEACFAAMDATDIERTLTPTAREDTALRAAVAGELET
jgi:hypothetical protein